MYSYRLLYHPPSRRQPKESFDVVVATSYVKDGVQIDEILDPTPVELSGESTGAIIEKLQKIITDLAKNPKPLTKRNIFVLAEENDDAFFIIEEKDDEVEDVMSFIGRYRE